MSRNSLTSIRLRGVRQNNLKNIDVDIPLGQLTVVTGRSGAGKSSLVFETLHAEGQRRYVETFSPYTRQFLDMMDRPDVDSIESIPPSIAIEQSNSVRTSRSTVGTMTELCDFFKVWFAHASDLYDPVTGERIENETPQLIWKKTVSSKAGQTVLVSFALRCPQRLQWHEVLGPLVRQGFLRLVYENRLQRTEALSDLPQDAVVYPVVDRIRIEAGAEGRFIEAAESAFRLGNAELQLWDETGKSQLARFSQGLHTPGTDRRFQPASPALFSFNSPLGACPQCRGFGRVIEIDPKLVVPDHSLSLNDGAIKAFQGEVYQNSLDDLRRAATRHRLRLDVPWQELSELEKQFVWAGDPDYREEGSSSDQWYGIDRFFKWLEENTYKMHVRVFLSRYRSYVQCPACGGARLQPEALLWKWKGYRLPDLYQLPVDRLRSLMLEQTEQTGNHPADLALDSILTRLDYLEAVGLGYLTLDRASRTLSGGEVERVNLTACLGTGLVDTLFVLDEPSVGLHARDIDRLIGILRSLVEQGNTVVVVEHDEAIIRSADHLIEIGPEPGEQGGEVVFAGSAQAILTDTQSLTGRYLSGKWTIAPPEIRRPVQLGRAGAKRKRAPMLCIEDATCHNLKQISLQLPLQRLVALAGVSGSGKSTLMDNVLYQGIQQKRGKIMDRPAQIARIAGDELLSDVILVDQGPVARTPRSNPALYCEAWDAIRSLYARTQAARESGMTTSHFSFNSGQGRCDHCGGLGYEKVEMQFLSDVYVVCPVCDGDQFRQDVLDVQWHGRNVADVLKMTVTQALLFFADQFPIRSRLEKLAAVGLGYLKLGQPLNTLSGGESQRLKLVRYLSGMKESDAACLILLDEPTTGLHRDDVKTLLKVLQQLVDVGHSVCVIEHQMDVLAAADWIIELGPEAGARGGEIVATGTPEQVAQCATVTAGFLQQQLAGIPAELQVAEESMVRRERAVDRLEIIGAREHNLKNLTVSIPHGKITVVTGVSGSGKSTLAFDIVFAEGQRRFMESMSPYARQFVEQMPRPDVDRLQGLSPTVAIEQRVTRGSRKSTVATITEVAQYLRLLYARLGVQYNPATGNPVESMSPGMLLAKMKTQLRSRAFAGKKHLYLCAPVIRGRKGHHQPVADWAREQGYALLRVDGKLIRTRDFTRLDRYREHDIEVVVTDLGRSVWSNLAERDRWIDAQGPVALRIGKGGCLLVDETGAVQVLYSTLRTDPLTGEAFPELDPKHFSWNSAKGWCPMCRGHGFIYSWMLGDEDYPQVKKSAVDGCCPECEGDRLNRLSRAVRIQFEGKKRRPLSIADMLRLTPDALLDTLKHIRMDAKAKAVMSDLLPQITERLAFLDKVGLNYLTLDRATNTLSGGEAQRIRLAAQLGSNLSGVLYVLDEPSIGLHARDNARLIETLQALRQRGNTLLVVEHDEETMMAADKVIDLGPGAGIHGGELLAQGTPAQIKQAEDSLTGLYLCEGMRHPLRGERRALPTRGRAVGRANSGWVVARQARLRNLKGDTVYFPIGRLSVVCGVSGAGKSTLWRDLLLPLIRHAAQEDCQRLTTAAIRKLHASDPQSSNSPAPLRELVNGNVFRQVIEVDQEPIGKTPRSTPATYIGVFDQIRQFFASLPESRMRGYTAGRFSFNTAGGRCEKCKGAGRIKLEMSFLPDTYVVCDACDGGRYGTELSEIRWNDRNIAEVLDMSVEEAADFFSFSAKIAPVLQLMVETGLGYLKLGQSSPTLSGGEAQRLKLVSELARALPRVRPVSADEKKNLYLLEEPTIGLHLSDCKKLIDLLHRLVDQGHTVVVIEHHLDVIAEADYVMEVGPEGGEAGGRIVYQGPFDGLRECAESRTAAFLRKEWSGGSVET